MLRGFASPLRPFRASTAVSRRTGTSTCDVYRRTGVHFTPPGRSKTRRRFQSAWYRSGARKTVFGRVCTASPGMALITHTHECAHPSTLAPSACFNEVCNLPLIKLGNSSVFPPEVVAFLPLAIKEQPVIDAERYISAVGFSVLVYDLLLTFGDEVRYIWRRPVTNIKVLYLFLRYGVTIAQIIYFQSISGLRTSQICVGSLIVLALVGSMSVVLANYIMIIRVYTLWDHRKWMLRTLYIGYSLSVCSTIAFVATSIVQLAPHVIHDPFIFHMCLITGRSPYWIGIWLSQALFDVFLFVLTITNAASRPRRANVKIITDLRRDGLVFYLGLFGELLLV
ncbi:hypothetical protein EDB84DRAFT_821743 [Lactarius hengduanensis]|nr:hypothetical protein EDB84DRAFT_821743 [Lactarius hengduanensis]